MTAESASDPGAQARAPAGVALLARSLLFMAWMYGLMAVMGILCLPLLLGPRRWVIAPMRLWCRWVLGGLRVICGVRVEVKGLEHLPSGPCLIAAKHEAMLDTIAPFVWLEDPAFVLKRELMRLPVYGWYTRKAEHIPIDREGSSKTLRALMHAARDRLDDGRPVVIFPEGTRQRPGAAPDYKPGVAALYRELNAPCAPMATNSGLCWPAHGIFRRPGVVTYVFLPAIPPGLKRASFMATLEERIEGESERLLQQRTP